MKGRLLPWIISFVLAIFVVLVVIDHQKGTWTAVYFPDGGNLSVRVRSGPLKSLNDCRSWILRTNNEEYRSNKYGYECGKNCEVDVATDYMMCEETLK